MAHSPDSVEKHHYQEKEDRVVYDPEVAVQNGNGQLHKTLKSRHMQMIAIGGAIGAGLFVGSGGALATGGPGSLIICYCIIGIMLLFTVQALGELAVLYPVNGAFFDYICRFVDDSWGFAMGWDYAISWLIILPFEITAACVTINFWEGGRNIQPAVWVTVFLVVLVGIQIFGVRGFGEVEFVLAVIKILGCVGFIILGIIINCGGVPTDNRGYLGVQYWHNGLAFQNGFKGFCSVFVVAAFAYAGTELAGLAAAEAENPRKSIPQATKQVFWRIAILYILNLFILSLVISSANEDLGKASSGADTRYSPFVLAIQAASIPALPSIFNVIICLAVISVANSSSYGSTRTIQALAVRRMAPRFFEKIDKQGRPIWCVALQVAFGFLAYLNSAPNVSGKIFGWLLALSGIIYFFVWGSICLAHIRFRMAWKHNGRSVEQIPYKAPFGIWGSAFGLTLNILCLIAQFYVAVWPIPPSDGPPLSGAALAEEFFGAYLAGPVVLVFYLFWKVWSRQWRMWVPIAEIDVTTGLRDDLDRLIEHDPYKPKAGLASWPKRIVRSVF